MTPAASRCLCTGRVARCGFRKLRRSNSGNSCLLVLCSLRVVGVKDDVSSAHRGSVELQEAAAFEDAVDDGLGEVVVVQDAPPGPRCDLFAVKIIGRFFRCRSLTTWKRTLAASVP